MVSEAEEGGKRGEGAALMAVTEGRIQREGVGSAGTRSRESGRLAMVVVVVPTGRKQKGQIMAAAEVLVEGKQRREGTAAVASTLLMCWAARSTCVGAGRRARGCLWPFRSAGGCPSWCRPRAPLLRGGSELPC